MNKIVHKKTYLIYIKISKLFVILIKEYIKLMLISKKWRKVANQSNLWIFYTQILKPNLRLNWYVSLSKILLLFLIINN